MWDYTGWIVQARAGRDRDGVFCVVDTVGDYVLRFAALEWWQRITGQAE